MDGRDGDRERERQRESEREPGVLLTPSVSPTDSGQDRDAAQSPLHPSKEDVIQRCREHILTALLPGQRAEAARSN